MSIAGHSTSDQSRYRRFKPKQTWLFSRSLHPMETPSRSAVTSILLTLARTIDRTNFFPTVVAGASEFALGNPFAFLLACCLDRGTKTEIIWTIPFDLAKRLGHLDPTRIAATSLEEIRAVVDSLPRRPRYIHSAPRTLRELAELVVRGGGPKTAQPEASSDA